MGGKEQGIFICYPISRVTIQFMVQSTTFFGVKEITLRHLGKLKKKIFLLDNWYIWLATLYQESVHSQPTLEDRVPPDRVSALIAFLFVCTLRGEPASLSSGSF